MKLLFVLMIAPSIVPAAEEEGSIPPPPKVATRQPTIASVFPMAAQPGQSVDFEVRGEFLDGCRQMAFETSDLSAKVTDASFTRVHGRLTVGRDAPTGPRYFRLITPRGATNLLVVRVTRWPVVSEVDANGEIARANRVSAPALISGHLFADMIGRAPWGEEADLYRFHAKAGERLKLEVLGARNWSTADLSLTLMTATGRQLDSDEGLLVWDPYMDVTFPKEGDYIAAVSVTRTLTAQFSRFDWAFYQLVIGRAPEFWNVFPNGVRRGSEVEAELRADFLPEHPAPFFRGTESLQAAIETTAQQGVYKLKVRAAADAPLGVQHMVLPDDSGTLIPLSFVVGDLPEKIETEPNDNRQQAELLKWPVTVNGRMNRKADQDWYRVQVKAGQKLVFDVQGENYGGSKLDATLTLLDGKGKQLVTIDDGPAAGRGANRDPRIEYEFKDEGEYFVKVASIFRHSGPDQIYRLTVREPRPDFQITMTTDRLSAARGGRSKLPVNVSRTEGSACEVTVEVSGLPAGVTAKPLMIPAKEKGGAIELTVGKDAPLATTPLAVTARCGDMTRAVVLPGSPRMGNGPGYVDYRPQRVQLTVTEPARYSLDCILSTVYLVRGGEADVGIKLARAAGFDAPLEFALENAPPGVTLVQSEIVDEGKQARLRLRAGASAQPARIADLVFIAKSKSGDHVVAQAAPKVALQLD
jgi:hypothetical protein